jgi:hypothetical protein
LNIGFLVQATGASEIGGVYEQFGLANDQVKTDVYLPSDIHHLQTYDPSVLVLRQMKQGKCVSWD